MRHYFWIVTAFLVWLIPAAGQEQNAKEGQVVESTLPPVEVWNVLRSNVLIVERVNDLPEDVRTALAQALYQNELEMGDRDHKVKRHCADCVLNYLIFAGISPEACFVYYSAIGFASLYKIIVFDTTRPNRPRLLWAALGVRADNVEHLRSLIAEGKFHPYRLQPHSRP